MNHHMRLRGRVYYLRKRVPPDVVEEVGRDFIEESLRTSDVREARKRRDARLAALEREWELLRRVGNPNEIESVIAEAELERRVAMPEDAPTIGDKLADRLDEAAFAWARKEGLADAFGRGMDPDEVRERFVEETKEGQRLYLQLEATQGGLPIDVAGGRWIAKTQLKAGTQREYRRFFKAAAEQLPPPHRVTRDDARLFAQRLAEEGGVDGSGYSRKTVSNHLTALSRLWGYLGLDNTIWLRIAFEPAKAEIKRDIWTLEETIRLLDAARALKGEAGAKLPLVIRLALYTGERAKEIAGMRYDAENDWIVIRREDTKTDAGERAVPCPDAIRADVKAWVADPWSTQSVSNRFSELKRGLGFTGRNKVLHSFRHTLLSRLHELGVQEATAAKIVGHKHKGMTYGTYGSKTSVESLREIMNALDWDQRLEEERAVIARRQQNAL